LSLFQYNFFFHDTVTQNMTVNMPLQERCALCLLRKLFLNTLCLQGQTVIRISQS